MISYAKIFLYPIVFLLPIKWLYQLQDFINESKFSLAFLWGGEKQSTYLSIYTDVIRDIGVTLNNSVFNSYMNVPFEDYNFMCISKYDEYLSSYYGDYMKIPETIINHNRI